MGNIIQIKTELKIDNRINKYVWSILLALLIDQIIKILVFHHLDLHQEVRIIGDWFRLRLELNDGMAFSNLFKNETDRYLKIILKVLVSFIVFVSLVYYINKQAPETIKYGLALCFAGLTGNMIDRVFYGVLLNNNLDIYTTKWFHGRIIDMFYFPLFEIHLPDWLPVAGGSSFIFFEPVFNFADAISVIGAIMAVTGLMTAKKMNPSKIMKQKL